MTKDDEVTEDATRLAAAKRQLERLFSRYGDYASKRESLDHQSAGPLNSFSDKELEVELDELEAELDQELT
jgi:hypothetical protein